MSPLTLDILISKRPILLPSAILAGLLIVYSGWWWIAAGQLATTAEHWIVQEKAKGATISPATVAVRGFPLAFSIVLANPQLAWPDGFGFTGQLVRVAARPWSFGSFRVTATGGFAFTVPPGSARPAYTIAGQTLRGRVAFAGESVPTSLVFTADSVSASRAVAQGQPTREMIIATLELDGTRPSAPPKADTDPALELSLHLLDIAADALDGNPLGGTIAEATLHAKIMGSVPATLDSPGLTAWRDSGGTIEIPTLGIKWGPLSLSGNGTIALDTAMQPEAAFTARIAGYEKAIDALVKAGWTRPGAAGIAKIGLAVASRPGPDGQQVAEVPVSIQQREIMIGPAKVGQIPELTLE